MPPILRTDHAPERVWERAQELLDARLRPSDDEALMAAALEGCPDELEAILLLEATLDELAGPASTSAPVPTPAARRPRLAPLLRPAVAAGLLACLALWSTRPGPGPALPTLPQHFEVNPATGPYGLGQALPAPTSAPSIQSFSLTVSRSRLAAQPLPAGRQDTATYPAIRELVATRTHSTPNRP